MTYYPLVQLVATPDLDAEVRCDLNADTTWADADAFSLGVPQLLGDPGGVGSDYGYRTLTFNLAILDGEFPARAKQSELARELLRDENYLLFQLSENAPPVWFRCVRSSPGEMSMAQVYLDLDSSLWTIAVSLVADPFALGDVTNAVPDGSSTATVANDPALTNGLSLRLANIAGDAPAPLNVALTPGTDGYVQPLISVMPLDAEWAGVPFWQAESWTLVTTGASVTSDASASGGRRVTVRLNSKGDARTRRLTGAARLPFAGRYRLFARVKIENPSLSVIDTLGVEGTGAALVSGQVTNIADAGGQRWRIIELGTYAFPKGNMPGRRPYSIGTGPVGIDVGTSNSGADFNLYLHIDYIVAIPVDLPLDQTAPATTLEFVNASQTAGDVTLLLNAEDETVEEITGGQHLAGVPEVPHGSFLAVVPGATNALTFLPRRWRNANKHDDRLTESNTLQLTYRPRWLYLADG